MCRAWVLALGLSTTALLGGCAGANEPPDLATNSPTVATPSVEADPAEGLWGLPVTRTVTTTAGWTYEIEVSRLPVWTVSANVTDSPPGYTQLTLQASEGVTISATSLDEGRNAPEPSVLVDAVGWRTDGVPAPSGLGDYREFVPVTGEPTEMMACTAYDRLAIIECGAGDWDPNVNPSGDTFASGQTPDLPEELATELLGDFMIPTNLYASIAIGDPNGHCVDHFFIRYGGQVDDGQCDDRLGMDQ